MGEDRFSTINKGVRVVKSNNHIFEVDEQNLQSVLLQEDIRDKHVSVISVAGAFRKGKSFLLNFMIRYLEAKGQPLWLGNRIQPLKGFSWRGGCERDTTGILLWSKVYLINVAPNEDVAVILMDTQGAFDCASTVKEWATVFALSMMLSSIQIYNLSQNIQETDLQHLQLFTEYGRLAIEDSHEIPFQKLVFLVRDWSYPYNALYGLAGGDILLEKRLEIKEEQHPQLQQLRRHIKSCFSEVSCFLMPHPGLIVATNGEFDGKLSDIRQEFTDYLEKFVPTLLRPENLVIKRINGRCLTAKELIQYFRVYVGMFQGNELPEPKSMLEATAEANNLTALAIAKEFYSTAMKTICGENCPYVKSELLKRKHCEIKQLAMQKFSAIRRMGSADLTNQYLEKLDNDADRLFGCYLEYNNGKKVAHILHTPMFLTLIIFITYAFSYYANIWGLHVISQFLSCIVLFNILTLCTWGYTRLSGEYQDIGRSIDDFVEFFSENYIAPSHNAFLKMTTEARREDIGHSSTESLSGNSDTDIPRQRNLFKT